jgi:hypothetical protein
VTKVTVFCTTIYILTDFFTNKLAKTSLSSPPRITTKVEPGTSLEVGQHPELRSLGFGVTRQLYGPCCPQVGVGAVAAWFSCPIRLPLLEECAGPLSSPGRRRNSRTTITCSPTCCPTIIPISPYPVGRAWRCCAGCGRLQTGLSIGLGGNWLGHAGRWLRRRARVWW